MTPAASTDASPPLIPAHARPRARLAVAGAELAVRASLLVSPRPGALLVRRVFRAGGAATARSLARHAPDGIAVLRDERYGDDPDEVLDLYRPADAVGPLPTVVWIHGGGWVGGSKEELAGWLSLIAAAGYAVAAPRYGLAPEARYPTPLRQAMAALAHLQRRAARIGVDPARVVLGGDSAGAQIAAQVAALVTTPGYAATVGVAPTLAPDRLRGVVLACGPYDLALLDGAGPAAAAGAAGGHAADARPVAADGASARAAGAAARTHRFVRAVLWAYSGDRRYARNPAFAAASVAEHVTAAFPPALLTVGNADPLRAHSELLARRLRDAGAPVETVFFDADHDPPLGHEYQFDLDGAAGRAFLERMLTFLAARVAV